MLVTGGDGGYSFSGTGGTGGNASVSFGSDLTLTAANGSRGLTLLGGSGAGVNSGNVGGAGGYADLTVSGAVSADSSSITLGGNAGSGNGTVGMTESQGGNASVSLGSLTLTSNQFGNNLGNPAFGWARLNITGGQGGADISGAAVGGAGGSVSLMAGPVSVDTSDIVLQGGNAGSFGYGPSGTKEGSGGNASANLGDLTVTSSGWNSYGGFSNIQIYAGNGGNDNAQALGGEGGQPP